VDDLAVIIISTNEAMWLDPCLRTVFEHAGNISLDVVVADNESTDGTRELVEREFRGARVVTCANRGFAHGNNSGYLTCDARYTLFLNPDTEVLEGTFEQLVRFMDERTEIGVLGVKQVTADGRLYPTMRRFPNALRAFGEAIGSERMPFSASWLGKRELDLARYEGEVECDWTIGSFLLVRREAIESAGLMDERFFIYGDEVDFCRRIRHAGWKIVHVPAMTILHHADKGGAARKTNPPMVAQNAFAQVQYGRKHFSTAHRIAFTGAVALHHVLRSAFTRGDGECSRKRRGASREALRVVVGLDQPPFGKPPTQALALGRSRSKEDDRGNADTRLVAESAGPGSLSKAKSRSVPGRQDREHASGQSASERRR
jgi:GT2 family glycosyltransferase